MKVYIPFVLLILLLPHVMNVDYPKNVRITETEKYNQVRAKEVESLDNIQDEIINKEKNALIVFHTEWCGHCKEFIPIFNAASQYKLTGEFEFLKVNCHHKSICSHFRVNKYPTVKIFYKGKEVDDEPGRDLVSILELIDKFSSSSIVKLKSEDEVKEFFSDYGDGSGLLYYKTEDSEMVNCMNQLLETKYKSIYYFGAIHTDLEEKVTFPKKGNASLTIGSDLSCFVVEEFLERNKFSLVKRLDSSYVRRMQKENKISFLFAIDVKDNPHRKIVDEILPKFCSEYQDFVFSYIDYDVDENLRNYFKLKEEELPKLIVYDFPKHRYYSHPFKISNDEKEIRETIIEVALKIINDELIWSNGNMILDLLASLGIMLSYKGLIYLLGSLFIIFVVILVVIIFCCEDKHNHSHDEIEQNNSGELTQNEEQSLIKKKNQ